MIIIKVLFFLRVFKKLEKKLERKNNSKRDNWVIPGTVVKVGNDL